MKFFVPRFRLVPYNIYSICCCFYFKDNLAENWVNEFEQEEKETTDLEQGVDDEEYLNSIPDITDVQNFLFTFCL